MRILRKFLAIFLILLLVFGTYIAIKGFSGFDPLALSGPKLLGIFTEQGKRALTDAGVGQISQVSHATSLPMLKAPIQKEVILKIALVADSENDNNDLKKALVQAKALNVDYVVGIGDWTNVGTLKELNDVKKTFDQVGLPYYLVPGDHDLWDNKNKGQLATANFEAVFGRPYQSVETNGVKQVFIDNANLDSGLDSVQWQWLSQVLTSDKSHANGLPLFVFIHKPLYHPTTSHIMANDDLGRPNNLAPQRQQLLSLLAANKVAEVFSGDVHFFSQYREPTTQLAMTTIGAITNVRNLQNPRFAEVIVYKDGSYDVKDIEVSQ